LLYRWAYTGIQGALTFCQDKVKGGLWFRVVDLIVSSLGLGRKAGRVTTRLMLSRTEHKRCSMGA
jgi:hypothetical protein